MEPKGEQTAFVYTTYIEDVGHGVVKLTVTHDGFAPGSAVLPAIAEGWPAVLASLKTLLETGSSLRTS
jgi:Activator of Hsp90 ATPase homolog 1-like protein